MKPKTNILKKFKIPTALGDNVAGLLRFVQSHPTHLLMILNQIAEDSSIEESTIKLTSLIKEKHENRWLNFDWKYTTFPKGVAVNRYSKLMNFPDESYAVVSNVQPTFKPGDKIDKTWAKSTNARPYVWVVNGNKIKYHGMKHSMIGVEDQIKKYKK